MVWKTVLARRGERAAPTSVVLFHFSTLNFWLCVLCVCACVSGPVCVSECVFTNHEVSCFLEGTSDNWNIYHWGFLFQFINLAFSCSIWPFSALYQKYFGEIFVSKGAVGRYHIIHEILPVKERRCPSFRGRAQITKPHLGDPPPHVIL